MLLMSLVFVNLVQLYTHHGKRPRPLPDFQFSGTGVVAQSCAATCQITRKDGAIIDIFYGGSWFDCFFFTSCPGVITLTALQAAGAVVCVHDYRAVRTEQSAPPL